MMNNLLEIISYWYNSGTWRHELHGNDPHSWNQRSHFKSSKWPFMWKESNSISSSCWEALAILFNGIIIVGQHLLNSIRIQPGLLQQFQKLVLSRSPTCEPSISSSGSSFGRTSTSCRVMTHIHISNDKPMFVNEQLLRDIARLADSSIEDSATFRTELGQKYWSGPDTLSWTTKTTSSSKTITSWVDAGTK